MGENLPSRSQFLIGITVVVGAASGLYLLSKSVQYLSQISERRQRKKRTEEPCNVCCINLDTENIKSSVKCVNCQKIACRGQSCSIWIPSQSGWECQLCNQSQESISKSSEWLNQQIAGKYLNPLSARSEPALQRSGLSPQPELDRQSDAASSYYGEQKERVREMIEETLAEMLGGSLDNISVNQLYKSRQYLELFCKYHSLLSNKLHRLERSMLLSQSLKDLPTWENGEAPGISQLKLKRFIEKIINDTLRLPDFTNEPLTPGPTYDQNLPFFDPKKYQELLATAVLNKIVDSYNYEQKFDKIKDAATDCSDLDKNHNALIGRKVQSGSVSSSSIEPESDCSITDPPTNISRCNDFSRSDSGSNLFSDILNRGDQNDSSMLSKYLAKHNVPLPDFSIDSDSSVEDNIPSEDHFGNTWEGNWLFKKKRPGHESPAAVGMLVPCPKEDVKTQIGDKTADELSDLSEAGSECGDNNIDEIEDNPPNALIQNRNIIGGKSPIGIFDELLEQTSLISTSSIPDGDTLYTETKNNFVLGDDLEHDLPKHNGHFHTDEAINSLVDTQQLQNNLSRSKEWGRKSHMKENINESQASRMRSAQKHPIYISTKDIPESELTSSSTASSGSIAEREHKKWYNAVDMPNNPYSKEALKKRLSNTSDRPIDIPNINSPLEQAKSEDKIKEESGANKIISDANKLDYKRYGRDYYINDAKFTSNGNKSKLTASTSLYSLNTTDDKSRDKELSLQLQQPLSSSLSSLHRSHSWGDKRSNIVPDGGSSNCDIFTARPVRVEESDPILSKATKLEYLSTPDRDFYLLPTEEISSLRSISASEHSLSQAGDSLTPSEDSDTIRVYDLKTQETRLIRDDESIIAVTAVKGLNKTDTNRVQHPASSRPQLSTQRSIRTTVVNRGSTPTAFKFLQPKRRLYDTRRVMSEDTSSPTYDRENVSRSNGTPEKSVIEEDVLPALPSVKALMKAFQNPSQDSNVQLNRPKSYSWKSVENNTKEEPTAPAQPPKLAEPVTTNGESVEEKPATPAGNTQPQEIATRNGGSNCTAEPSKDSYSPSYEQKYIPAEAPVLPPESLVVCPCPTSEQQNKSPEKAEPIKEEKQVHFEEVPATAAAPSSETENRQEEVTNESVQTAQPEKLIDLSPMSQQVSEPIGEPLSPQEPCKDSYSPPYDQKYCPAEPETAQAPEEKANEQNSLEWKDENVEIVSIPKDEQQATPPNTPDDANQETPVQSTLIVMVTPKEESTPEPAQATPAREPTVVEKFIENEKQASMPPVDVKPAVEPEQKPTPEVVETETAPNPSTEPTALVEPTPTPAPVAESTQSSITEPSPVQTTETTAAPVSTPAEEKDPEIPAASSPEPVAENSQQTVETQPAENGFHEASPASPPPEVNDELPKQSIVEQKRAEIRFTQESPVRERPISPVLVPGKLKSSIAFFENLNKK